MDYCGRISKQKPKTFPELFPEVPEDKLEEAENRFNRYLRIVARIYARLHHDPEILEISRRPRPYQDIPRTWDRLLPKLWNWGVANPAG